jgi:SAM-dependent methyltransferase
MGNTFDEMRYSNLPLVETHPDRLAVLARLRGMDPPPVENARVLDLGANEGGNLIPMAWTLPAAQLTGIDLAAAPVDRGNQVIRELGLKNVRLLRMNLLDVDESFGEFDYVIAHGLYAWTPPPVRDKVLAIARANLSPNGIAFISYNTYPGGHIRKLIREILLFHARDVSSAEARVARAREILTVAAAAATPVSGEFARVMAAEAERTLQRNDSALIHDIMVDDYEPVYFRDFVAHAASHGLAYVDDASVTDTWNTALPESVEEAVRGMTSGDSILWEQYLDLLRARVFRRSLVGHAETPVRNGWVIACAAGMYAAAAVREGAEGGRGEIQFIAQSGATLTTQHVGVIEFLRRLSAVWPQAVQLTEPEAEMALMLFRRGFVDVRTVPGVAVRAGDKPLVSPLVRYQVQQGWNVSTLLHTSLEISNEAGREFLLLLDGTRDRDALAREMDCTREQVEEELDNASRHGLLLQ